MNIKKLAIGAAGGLLMLGTFATAAFASTVNVTDQASLVSALATASSGDTIVLSNGFNVTSEVAVNASGVTIDGNGQTLTPTFAKTTNSNNATLGIYGADVTVENLTIDGTNGTNLHGINTYEATNVNLNNVTIENNDHNGLVVNGSTVTVDNLTTSNNAWGGVDVDLGSGVPGPATLTVNGVSNQSEAGGLDIYVDNTSKDVSVVDTNSQYFSADNVLQAGDRVYTLASAAACKKGGWQDVNTSSGKSFKNQGDCVSYVQSNSNAVGNKTK